MLRKRQCHGCLVWTEDFRAVTDRILVERLDVLLKRNLIQIHEEYGRIWICKHHVDELSRSDELSTSTIPDAQTRSSGESTTFTITNLKNFSQDPEELVLKLQEKVKLLTEENKDLRKKLKENKEDPDYDETSASQAVAQLSPKIYGDICFKFVGSCCDAFICEKEQLQKLLNDYGLICKECLSTVQVIECRQVATCLEMQLICQCKANEKKGKKWTSQQRLSEDPKDQLYLMNLKIVAAANIVAINTKKLIEMGNLLSIGFPHKSSFAEETDRYFLPALYDVQRELNQQTLEAIRSHYSLNNLLKSDGSVPVFLAGDGQYSSPGHTADLMRYLLMDGPTSLIIDFHVLKCRDVGAACRMENLGCSIVLKRWAEEQKVNTTTFYVETFVSDQHSTIQKTMREWFPNITHNYDSWHVIKNWRKGFLKIAKRHGTDVYKLGLQLIGRLANHVWHSLAKADGNNVLLMNLLMSSLWHLIGKHEGFLNNALTVGNMHWVFTQIKKCVHLESEGGRSSDSDSEIDEPGPASASATKRDLNRDMSTFVSRCLEDNNLDQSFDASEQNEDEEKDSTSNNSLHSLDPTLALHEKVLISIGESFLSMREIFSKTSPKYATSDLERANSLSTTSYLSKALNYSKETYENRTILMIMDWNEKALNRLEERKARKARNEERELLKQLGACDNALPPSLPEPKKYSTWSKALKKMTSKTRNLKPEHLFRQKLLERVIQLVPPFGKRTVTISL